MNMDFIISNARDAFIMVRDTLTHLGDDKHYYICNRIDHLFNMNYISPEVCEEMYAIMRRNKPTRNHLRTFYNSPFYDKEQVNIEQQDMDENDVFLTSLPWWSHTHHPNFHSHTLEFGNEGRFPQVVEQRKKFVQALIDMLD